MSNYSQSTSGSGSASLHSPTAPKTDRRVLACMLCQQRKKKCDRQSPCSNCIRVRAQPHEPVDIQGLANSGSPQLNKRCVPSTPAPPRKRRRPTRELLDRLARCEEQLRLYSEHGCIHALSPESHCSGSASSVRSAGSPGTESTATAGESKESAVTAAATSMRTPPDEHHRHYGHQNHHHLHRIEEVRPSVET
jgi:hypothetical protein